MGIHLIIKIHIQFSRFSSLPSPTHTHVHAVTKFMVILELKICNLLSIFSGQQKQIQLVRTLMRSVSSQAACIWGMLSQAHTEVARLQSRASRVPLSQHLPMGEDCERGCKEMSTVGGNFQSLLSSHMRKEGWGPADFYDNTHSSYSIHFSFSYSLVYCVQMAS